jgi:membrane dipeptidase
MSDPIALHHRLLTLDSHIDIPWPDGPAFAAETARRVDLPKMRKGHLACGFFAAYVPQTRRSSEAHEAAYARAIGMLGAIRAMGHAEGARLCRTADDIETAFRDGATAIVPAVENGHACAADPARLRQFAALGARYMTLTHTGHNALSDSSNPRADLGDAETEHGGLSEIGRAAVAEMNRLGMVVDISHVSKAAMLQAAALSRTPVVATHSCVRALCDNLRNLDNEQLDALRDTGGVAQMTAVPYFLRPGGRAEGVTPADFADHIDYAVNRIGLAHVGISSDFDGGGGFTGWHDAAESPGITAELARRGYGEAELSALWSGNFLRVLRAAESAAD